MIFAVEMVKLARIFSLRRVFPLQRMYPATLAVLAITALGSPVQAKTPCDTPQDIQAVQVRQLQVQGVMATLRCPSADYDFHAHYNAFIERVNPLMSDNAKHLKSMVSRQGKGNLDKYLTALFSDVQTTSQADPYFCDKSVKMLDDVAALTSQQVPGYAQQAISSPYGVDACPEQPVNHEATAHKKKRNKTTPQPG